MSAVKKVWFTQHGEDLHALSIESAHVTPDYMRLKVDGLVFPEDATKKQRHVICIKLLSTEDLEKMYKMIGQYLQEMREDQ